MNIFIIGASGYLGSGLYERFKSTSFQIYGSYFENKTIDDKYVKLNVNNLNEVNKVISEIKPNIVVFCAGIVEDDSKKQKESIKKINSVGVQNVSKICKKIDSHLIYISSAAVFDGKIGKFTENDIPLSKTVYGKSKLLGEKIINTTKNNLIIRCSLIIGKSNNSKHRFYGKLIETIKHHRSIIIDSSWKFKPTSIDQIFDLICWWIIEDKFSTPLIHIQANQTTTKYEIAKKLSNKTGRGFFVKKIKKVSPPNNTLNSKHIKKSGFPKYSISKMIKKIIFDEKI